MDDEPKLYEVTVKLEVWVTYGVEAYEDEQAEELVIDDARKDLPPGWDLADWEIIEMDDNTGAGLEEGKE